MEAPIIYQKSLGTDLTLQGLIERTTWEHRDAPRQEAFWCKYQTDYTYGRGLGVRTYSSTPIPEWTKKAWAEIEQASGCLFEACFLNYYLNQTDHLGWHADDSPIIDEARPIAVYTLGAEREIWFRVKPTAEKKSLNEIVPVNKLLLNDTSLLLMKAGMQQTHQHRIPKAGFVCGARVSLTFRGLKPAAAVAA